MKRGGNERRRRGSLLIVLGQAASRVVITTLPRPGVEALEHGAVHEKSILEAR